MNNEKPIQELSTKEYIANCLHRIIDADSAPAKHHQLMADIVDAFLGENKQLQNEAHEALICLVQKAESGEYL